MDYVEPHHYDRGMRLLERLSLERLRRGLLREARGAVLELGTGTGANLPLYGRDVQVTAIDVRPGHLAAAGRKARRAGMAATVVCANAQDLPYADAAFDTVVGTLVFCSIDRPEAALAEVRRVLRPDGRLLLLEHVRGLTPWSRRLTDWLHPLWFALQGECRLNRETAATVAAAGFHLDHTASHGRGLLQIIRATPIAEPHRP